MDGDSLADETNGGQTLVADHIDDIVILERDQGFPELYFSDFFLLVADQAFLGLRIEVVVQILVFYTCLSDFIPEVLLDFFNEVNDCLDARIASMSHTSRDDVHVDLSSLRVSGTLLHRSLDQSYCLLDILLAHLVGQTHPCQ